MWDVLFWKDAAERAVKTAAQSALAFFVVGKTAFGELDWAAVGGAAAVGAVASLLSSIASEPFGVRGSASLVKEVE